MAKAKVPGELNGFLDAKSKIEGELRFDETFRVDGSLHGRIVSRGALVVGEEGTVGGEIQVGQLFVSGTVTGSVRATERVEISAGARVEADVDTPTLVVEEGAHFSGACLMGEASSAERRSAPASPASDRALPVGSAG